MLSSRQLILSHRCRHFRPLPMESFSLRRMNARSVAPRTAKSRSAISNNRPLSTGYTRNTDIRGPRYTVHSVMCTHQPIRAYNITDLVVHHTVYATHARICTLSTSAHCCLFMHYWTYNNYIRTYTRYKFTHTTLINWCEDQ